MICNRCEANMVYVGSKNAIMKETSEEIAFFIHACPRCAHMQAELEMVDRASYVLPNEMVE